MALLLVSSPPGGVDEARLPVSILSDFPDPPRLLEGSKEPDNPDVCGYLCGSRYVQRDRQTELLIRASLGRPPLCIQCINSDSVQLSEEIQ